MLIKLTKIDESSIWVNPKFIIEMKIFSDGTTGLTVIHGSGYFNYNVKETPEQIIELINISKLK